MSYWTSHDSGSWIPNRFTGHHQRLEFTDQYEFSEMVAPRQRQFTGQHEFTEMVALRRGQFTGQHEFIEMAAPRRGRFIGQHEFTEMATPWRGQFTDQHEFTEMMAPRRGRFIGQHEFTEMAAPWRGQFTGQHEFTEMMAPRRGRFIGQHEFTEMETPRQRLPQPVDYSNRFARPRQTPRLFRPPPRDMPQPSMEVRVGQFGLPLRPTRQIRPLAEENPHRDMPKPLVKVHAGLALRPPTRQIRPYVEDFSGHGGRLLRKSSGHIDLVHEHNTPESAPASITNAEKEIISNTSSDKSQQKCINDIAAENVGNNKFKSENNNSEERKTNDANLGKGNKIELEQDKVQNIVEGPVGRKTDGCNQVGMKTQISEEVQIKPSLGDDDRNIDLGSVEILSRKLYQIEVADEKEAADKLDLIDNLECSRIQTNERLNISLAKEIKVAIEDPSTSMIPEDDKGIRINQMENGVTETEEIMESQQDDGNISQIDNTSTIVDCPEKADVTYENSINENYICHTAEIKVDCKNSEDNHISSKGGERNMADAVMEWKGVETKQDENCDKFEDHGMRNHVPEIEMDFIHGEKHIQFDVENRNGTKSLTSDDENVHIICAEGNNDQQTTCHTAFLGNFLEQKISFRSSEKLGSCETEMALYKDFGNDFISTA